MRITVSQLRRIIRESIASGSVGNARRALLAEGMPIVLSPHHLAMALEKNGADEELKKLKASALMKAQALKLGVDQEAETRGKATYVVMGMDGNGIELSIPADKLKGAGIFDPNSSKLL